MHTDRIDESMLDELAGELLRRFVGEFARQLPVHMVVHAQ